MSSHGVALLPSRLFAAEQGRELPRYDLLGIERVHQAQLKQLNGLAGACAQQVGACMAQLFNSADCELSYQGFTPALPDPANDTRFWVAAHARGESQQTAYLSVSPVVLYRLAVLFFGGRLQQQEVPLQSGRGPTDTEQRLLLRLCRYQLEVWSAHLGWGDLEWQLSPVTRDALPTTALWATGTTLMVGGHANEWQFWLMPPQEAAGAAVSSRLQEGALAHALGQTPVRLRVMMGQLAMTLADLECLQVGDVLSLELPEVVPALIGGRPCFSGRVAEQKGCLVYQVATVVEE